MQGTLPNKGMQLTIAASHRRTRRLQLIPSVRQAALQNQHPAGPPTAGWLLSDGLARGIACVVGQASCRAARYALPHSSGRPGTSCPLHDLRGHAAEAARQPSIIGEIDIAQLDVLLPPINTLFRLSSTHGSAVVLIRLG